MRLTWHKWDKRGCFGTPTPFHVGMPLQPPALRNHLARTPLRFGRKSTTLDSGDSYYSSEWLYGTAKKKKKTPLHLLLDSYSGAQGWLLHVFCILQLDQVPSSQTKNLKLMNISCHGQCWMRYRHIHVWNPIWEMPERRRTQPYIKGQGSNVPGLNTGGIESWHCWVFTASFSQNPLWRFILCNDVSLCQWLSLNFLYCEMMCGSQSHHQQVEWLSSS